MEYRTLGLSGLRISAVGLGYMGMSHAYGAPADKCKITELLTDAVDMGYTFITEGCKSGITTLCTGYAKTIKLYAEF